MFPQDPGPRRLYEKMLNTRLQEALRKPHCHPRLLTINARNIRACDTGNI